MLPSAQLTQQGFSIVPNVYTPDETNALLHLLEQSSGHTSLNHHRQQELFAIRQVVKEIPGLLLLLLNERMRNLIHTLVGEHCLLIKSIYFNKPAHSNWFVAYHQDLMLAVEARHEVVGFGPWTNRKGQVSVQPPVAVLEQIYTIRIHLDDTDTDNGALKVIPGSHKQGVVRAADCNLQEAVDCPVPAGGVMLMQPLLMHASARSQTERQRRVIHVEITTATLPPPLMWAEQMEIRV